jgi:uncharacterized membrane protein
MLILVVGIVLFLGAHSLTTFRGSRAKLIERFGAEAYKGFYSLVAGIGLVLIVWGFSRYRTEGFVPLWTPPVWARHFALALMWVAFVSMAFANPAPSRIRGWLRHPMLVAVKVWAFAHFLVNGDAGGMLLFGSFLAWSIYDRIAVKNRGDIGAARLAFFTRADAINVAAGTAAYVVMLFLHPYLIGVDPLGS